MDAAEAGIGGYQRFLDAGEGAMTSGLGRVTGAQPMLEGAARRVTGDEVSQYMNPFQEAIQSEINALSTRVKPSRACGPCSRAEGPRPSDLAAISFVVKSSAAGQMPWPALLPRTT